MCAGAVGKEIVFLDDRDWRRGHEVGAGQIDRVHSELRVARKI